MKNYFILIVMAAALAACASCGNNATTQDTASGAVPADSAVVSSTTNVQLETTTEPTEADDAWRESYPKKDVKLLDKFIKAWNSEEKDFSDILVYRDDTGYIEDAENLKSGNWNIAGNPDFAFVKSFKNYSIVGEYTDKTSDTWASLTRVRDANAAGTIKPLYLDPDNTSIYLLKLDVEVDDDIYNEYVSSKSADPKTLMPDEAYSLMVVTTIGKQRLVFDFGGGDYVVFTDAMGFTIPEAEMERWLEREKLIQQDWE